MHQNDLIAQGLARLYKGRLIPIMKGGDGRDEDLFAPLPADLGSLTVEQLGELIDAYAGTIQDIAAKPAEFISESLNATELVTLTKDALAVLDSLKAQKAALEAEPALSVEDAQAQLDELAALAKSDEPEPDDDEPEPEPEPEPEAEAAADVETETVDEPITAAGRGRLPKPTAATMLRHRSPAADTRVIPLVASGGVINRGLGESFENDLDIAQAMIDRRGHFGDTSEGVSGEKYGIARASWKGMYGPERTLGRDEISNREKVEAVVDTAAIKAEMQRRKKALDDGVLIASGGLCAPVTPYYNLQYISTPERPVMASLPSFNADRGGLRYARPAALSAVTTGVGLRTAAQDGAGGSQATKSCQVIACPPFQETDVDIIYHCLQFGNLGARAFPELVAQWNNLTLASHARLAESNLLTGIDGFSTAVTAGALGLGASATLFSQILTAADGIRSRNRMDPDAVLRVMLPFWAVDLIISDVIRTQFERFDTDKAKVIALLRTFNVEPTFYIDGANGKSQVFGAQNAGSLLSFPPTVQWYIFPEGTFIFLDGGTLELGIVRDSVLNATNDFQIFGETFENVAFVGVESLAVTSTVCDSGTVTLPHATTCPIAY